MRCRFCNNLLTHEFIDLGNAPPSNSFLAEEQLNEPEVFYPLKLFVCDNCWLVQIDEYKKSGEIFNQDYAYFSSFSKTWLEHAKKYVDMITVRLRLDAGSHVIEIASNDGYLLQYFKEKRIPCLGIEPSINTAKAAREKGIEILEEFFDADLAERLAREGRKADLIIGNNVLAHVPYINDFVKGLKIALNPGGVVTMEFPHLMRLIERNQFDTIYHEHFSYLSLHTVRRIFAKHNLVLLDVEELTTHGGSLRIYARHKVVSNEQSAVSSNVINIISKEIDAGLDQLKIYQSFGRKVEKIKRDILNFLIQSKEEGKTIVGYGAPAKGNTLLNYCGIRTDFLDYTVDRSPHKQNKYLPGTHIPIKHPDKIKEDKPDYVLILPWNIKDEIMKQMDYIREWGGKFIIPIPEIKVL